MYKVYLGINSTDIYYGIGTNADLDGIINKTIGQDLGNNINFIPGEQVQITGHLFENTAAYNGIYTVTAPNVTAYRSDGLEYFFFITVCQSTTPISPPPPPPPNISNSANYDRCADWNNKDGNVTTVGSNGGPSAYGTYDQGGNVSEWNEAVVGGDRRGARGGNWYGGSFNLSAVSRGGNSPWVMGGYRGFRITSSSNPLSLPYFVTVGDANNNADDDVAPGRTGMGSVNYIYQIGQYLVTNCEYAEFLNAVASTDTYGLSNAIPSFNDGITRIGSDGNYSYSVTANMGNKPANSITWFNAARYCNWLHNGKPSGGQDSSTTEDGAYTIIDGDTTRLYYLLACYPC